MIQELIAEGMTEAQIRAFLVAELRTNELTAQTIIDLELGRVVGDNLRVRADGSERAARAVVIEPKELNP